MDHGHGSDHLRAELIQRGIKPCIPPTRCRKVPLPYNKTFYRQRHRSKDVFGHLKDWCRITIIRPLRTHPLLSICLAVTVILWQLNNF